MAVRSSFFPPVDVERYLATYRWNSHQWYRVAGIAMASSPRELCGRYGLTYVETSELDIGRRRCGRGFAYLDPAGHVLREKTAKKRIKSLAIPPAWTEVCIASDHKAHIQAVGRDAEGRLQYRYHPGWDSLRSDLKRHRLLKFGEALGQVRSAVTAILRKPGLARKKVVAAVVRLMDRASLRPGHEAYARSDGGRGAATLTNADIEVSGDTIRLDFQGKGGKEIRLKLKDTLLAPVLRQLNKVGGRRLFKSPQDDRPVTAQEVNSFISEVSGADITAKDFRTFRASAKALELLAEEKVRDGGLQKAMVRVADQVSAELVNTRSVARLSYIHPRVFEAYQSGRLTGHLLKGRISRGLNRFESALLRLLKPASREWNSQHRSRFFLRQLHPRSKGSNP